MREGAWINPIGQWLWITEHASWIQKPENARLLGVSDEIQTKLSGMQWDFNGPGREAILRAAMNAGFIRVRGHGASVTFEFRLPIEAAIQVVRPFMESNMGPLAWCQFNDLKTGKCLGFFYKDLSAALKEPGVFNLEAFALETRRTHDALEDSDV